MVQTTGAIPFPNPAGTSLVSLPKAQARLARMGIIRTLRVNDDCLEGVGIFEGDEIICQSVRSQDDVDERNIYIVRVNGLDDTVSARVRFIGENMVTLHCCNFNGTRLDYFVG